MEVSSPTGSSSSGIKRQRFQVNLEGSSQIHRDVDPSSTEIICESTLGCEARETVIYDEDGKQKQVVSPNNILGSIAYYGLQNDASASTSKSSEVYLQDFNYYNDDEENNCNKDENVYDEEEDYNYDEDEGYEFYLEEDDKIDYGFKLAAQFDDLDLPPGVEATVPWLDNSAPKSSSNSKQETDIKFNSFKQFNIVQDFSDHHFAKTYSSVMQAKDWMKKIQKEWKLLEKNLPDTILVRVYEDRMDLLRAVIVGPAGTPYHDGLFFFDAQFPPKFPQEPPVLHYHSHGLCLNPNLYKDGKVCLSLLNTWYGKGCERWNPSESTMLQVLVSIQALILNEKPYFNEPGFELTANTAEGHVKSLAYNEEIFLLSCRTMLYSLRGPPKHFAEFVAGHFCNKGHTILAACRAYMSGAPVGSVIWEQAQDVDRSDERLSISFRSSLKQLFEELLMEFSVKGADCDEFLNQKVKAGAAAALSLQ
ncbi:putative ubiquitin-conjugating enzyme E2 38 isoform X1 [Musa acuminata AAA Group]|uniref:putative ubiquitin-conjugating enzyme E2 38 isoform X1 n=1 Tax=Musa acuminata AAA Group TaxID=214697 RepID=UPI0031DEC6C7